MKMRTMHKRTFSLLLALVLALALPPTAALAEGGDGPAASNNANSQNYTRAATVVNSYLFENGTGGLTRMEYVPAVQEWISQNGEWSLEEVSEAYVVVEDYNSDFEFQKSYSLPGELDTWGGFFAGEEHNFLIFGQSNPDEDDQKEVIRVVKYSKDWQRLGQASLYGANTTIPFRSGSLRAAEYDGELYIRTSHQMYKSRDGLNHQANLTMAVRESDMTVLDSYYIVMNSSVGYVSHSFNQFVIVDRNQNIVTLDHGDAYPRSAVLMVYNAKAGQGKFSGGVSNTTIQSFPGATGDNYTGASLGGLAETAGGYAVAYNYDGVGSSYTSADRSVYFAYVDKNSRSVETKMISGVGTSTPVLAPTGLDGGYILWNAGNDAGTLYYAAYSDGGTVGEVKTAAAVLSDCQPILYNGKVVWYTTTTNSLPAFYQLDENGVTVVKARFPSGAIPFTDVSAGDYFCQSVLWAVNKNITTGTGDGTTFSPDQTCTTAHILTFLWRAAGSPEVSSYYTGRFRDISESDYFYQAAGWACSRGMVSAVYPDYAFNPDTPCTRAMAMEYLWKMAGSPKTDAGSQFTDVAADASYAQAVAWAVQNGITTGTGDGTTFSPDWTCTRAEIATFLYRYMA